MAGDVRKIRGSEIAAIAEQGDGPGASDGGFTSLLTACWQATTNKGPYPFVAVGDTKPDWKRVLKGDLLRAVIYLRQISLSDGDVFEFDVQCEECLKKIEWQVKLSDLVIRKLPADSFKKIAEQKPFTIDILKDGQKFPAIFSLSTLAQEENINRFMKQSKRQVATTIDVLAGQITSIHGVKPDIKARYNFLAELSMGELYDLRTELDAFDCGFETEIEVKCQNRACQWEPKVNIPLLGRRFFFSKKRLTKKADSDDSQSPDGGDDSFEAFPVNGGGSTAPISGGTSTEDPATP